MAFVFSRQHYKPATIYSVLDQSSGTNEVKKMIYENLFQPSQIKPIITYVPIRYIHPIHHPTLSVEGKKDLDEKFRLSPPSSGIIRSHKLKGRLTC